MDGMRLFYLPQPRITITNPPQREVHREREDYLGLLQSEARRQPAVKLPVRPSKADRVISRHEATGAILGDDDLPPPIP